MEEFILAFPRLQVDPTVLFPPTQGIVLSTSASKHWIILGASVRRCTMDRVGDTGHLCSEVREHHGRKWPRGIDRYVQNPDTT
ncbi:hypothetical protein D3C84_879140 [compost metagenome]